MAQTVFERTGDHIAESARIASRAGSAVADAIGAGVGVAKRAAQQGADAAEEFLDETTERVRRHPVETMVTTFAVGLTAGQSLLHDTRGSSRIW